MRRDRNTSDVSRFPGTVRLPDNEQKSKATVTNLTGKGTREIQDE